MKVATKEWLKAAKDDLDTIERIIDTAHLSNVVAFHAQQCVEKCFKAIIEEHFTEPQKTHNLERLYKLVREKHEILEKDITILTKLNELYTEARYPDDFGLLPNGKPSIEEALEFYDFAVITYEEISRKL